MWPVVGPDHAAQVEVGDLDTPVLVHKEVGGLEVPVQDWRLVIMQLQHPLQQLDPSTAAIIQNCCSDQT